MSSHDENSKPKISHSKSSAEGKLNLASPLNRRNFLKFAGTLPVAAHLMACTPQSAEASSQNDVLNNGPDRGPGKGNSYPPAIDYANTKIFKNGYLSIIQGPTADTETLINIISPKLKNYTYEVIDSKGSKLNVTPYQRVKTPTFYVVDKLHIKGLKLGENYTLNVMDRTVRIDQRNFKTLDISKKTATFAQLSCMSDDYRFDEVIPPMWDRLKGANVEFVLMTGDQVYVDSKEFVERQKATEFDIWQRYVDAFKKLPIYHWQNLVPIFAVWDDHDYGTNDGDINFIGKVPSTSAFEAVFHGNDIPGVWEKCPVGTSSKFTAFGQRIFLMDDRSFRKPNTEASAKSDAFGHWGEEAHRWLINDLNRAVVPSWIINGNQFLSGKTLDYKESFQDNHPTEFNTLITELAQQKSAFVFASGDIHLSEIMIAPTNRLGFETYEYTASSMHSYTGTGWDNPLRMPDATTSEFNFMVHKVNAGANSLEISTQCLGLAPNPYFTKTLKVSR